MYSKCRIQYVDDGSELDVIIKEGEDFDVNDEDIFFYGLSADQLRQGMKDHTVFEGEWVVVAFYGAYDFIQNALYL